LSVRSAFALVCALAVVASGCSSSQPLDVHDVAGLFARTANYSALEADSYEGAWDPPLEEAGFDAIADAGFTAVRLPMRFSSHQSPIPPYEIDEEYLERIDWAIDQALYRGLAIIVDNHYWGGWASGDLDEIFSDPESAYPLFEAGWAQIAERYAEMPPEVVFQIMNEPHDNLDTAWNDIVADVLPVIRETNPDRAVIVNAVHYSTPWALESLVLPDDDHLIVDIHHYIPFDFTHQGAEWFDPVPPTGVSWPGQTVRLSSLWEDWSWGTERTFTAEGWEILAQTEWAGVTLHVVDGIEGVTEISFTTEQSTEFWVACSYGETDGAPNAHVVTEAGVPTTIGVEECGLTDDTLTEIRIPLGEDPSASLTLTDLEIVTATGSWSVFVTAEEEVVNPLDYAAAWSEAHGDVPLIVGEFGCSQHGDDESRAAWLKAVRIAAEERGIGWAFWEMQGTWGFWTPDEGVTDQWILDALLGD